MAERLDFTSGDGQAMAVYQPSEGRRDLATMTLAQKRETEDEMVIGWRQSPEEWARAHESWLSGHSGSDHTRRAYEYATKAFFESVNVQPWLVNGAHIRGWQQEMRDAGVSESTINQRLSALSSFFDFCERVHVFTLPLSLREVALSSGNPVRRVDRVKVSAYSESTALTAAQTRAMLTACNRTTVYGLRDYALILGYVLTGARNAEIRTLKWGSIQEKGDKVVYKWSGKRGKSDTEEMPRPVYDAIVAYLKAAERYETIQDEDYVFTAISSAATRLPNVDAMPANRPITGAMVNRIVKKVAKRAGLRWQQVHTHTLRHSAALIYYDLSGKDVRKVSEILHHSNPATTMIYLNHLDEKDNDLWQPAAALLGVS